MLHLDLSKIDPEKVFRDASPIKIGTQKTFNLVDNQGLPESQTINANTERNFDQALITLNGKRVCSVGNGMLLIASQGTGKSNVCESIASAVLRPVGEGLKTVDTLGFQFHPIDERGVLYVDTERTINDVARGFDRITKRTGLEPDKDGNHEKLTLLSLVYCLDAKRQKEIAEEFIKTETYSLVIIDGIADFVLSENDLEEAKLLIKWLIVLSARYSFGWVLTMHPNPTEAQGKAMGHLGTFLGKKVEASLNMFKHEHEKGVRIITTEQSAGKVRNDDDGIYQEIYFDKEQKMFLSSADQKSELMPAWQETLIARKSIERKEFEKFIFYNHYKKAKSLGVCKKFVDELIELGEVVEISGRIKLPDKDQMIDEEEVQDDKVRYLEPPEDDTLNTYKPSRFITGGDESETEEEPF